MKRLLFALVLAGVLSACGTTTIVPDPSRFPVRDRTAALKPGQSIALLNGYPASQMIMVGDRMQVDVRQVTDTAISVMARHLERNGTPLDPNASKKVTLRLVRANTFFMNIPFAQRFRTNMDLEAVFGDGTRTEIRAENSAPLPPFGSAHETMRRSVEGAVMFAVTDLLSDKRFVAYVNR